MIDFRYHIVSIVAVFLALTLGIVLGTYTINGQVLKNIRSQVKSLRSDNDGLRDRIRQLESDSGHDRSFISAIGPSVTHGQLTHQRVLVVAAPGASGGLVKDVAESVRDAGGTVTATVKVNDDWVDPTQVAVLGDLANRLADPVDLPSGSAYERAARVVAGSLLVHGATAAASPLSASDIATLAAFEEAKLLSVNPDRPGQANLTVVVAPAAPAEPTDADDAEAETVATLARELDFAGNGTVVVGPPESAQAGGVLDALRHDGDARDVVSSVDDADTLTGQVRMVLALAAELRGETGQYGVGPGAQRPAPDPEPSATASP